MAGDHRRFWSLSLNVPNEVSWNGFPWGPYPDLFFSGWRRIHTRICASHSLCTEALDHRIEVCGLRRSRCYHLRDVLIVRSAPRQKLHATAVFREDFLGLLSVSIEISRGLLSLAGSLLLDWEG